MATDRRRMAMGQAWRRRAGATAAAAFGLAVAGAAQAEQIDLGPDQRYAFAVNWSMFPDLTLATGEIRLTSGSQDYQMAIEAKAKLAGTPIDWKGEFETAGALGQHELKPKRFRRLSVRRPGKENEQFTDATVNWREEGAPVTEIVRKPKRVIRKAPAVDISQAGAVVDPLTFMLKMLGQVVKTNGEDCSTVNKTWDGERLAVIETVTAEKVPAARIDCQVVYKAILGLSTERNDWRVRENETRRIIRFRKIAGKWRPEFLRIDAVLIGGLRTTFTTTLKPVTGTGG